MYEVKEAILAGYIMIIAAGCMGNNAAYNPHTQANASDSDCLQHNVTIPCFNSYLYYNFKVLSVITVLIDESEAWRRGQLSFNISHLIHSLQYSFKSNKVLPAVTGFMLIKSLP